MQTLYLLLVLLVGSGLTFQAAINARLREYAGSAIVATLIQFAIGTLLLLVMAGGSGGFSSSSRLRSAPWWVFVGGFIGVAYVASAMIAVPRLGSTLLLIATVTGQMIAALLIDHNGWFGLDRTPLSTKRIAGAALLGGALWLLKK
jgi:transporter family-2 protein